MRPRARLRALMFLALGHLTSIAPVFATDPADPAARVPPARYESITAGGKSYRPVEPMPWADVNRRVAPPGSQAAPKDQPGQAPSTPKKQ